MRKIIGLKLWWFMLFTAWIFSCSFLGGYLTGKDHGHKGLPNCQEDEFLYPVDYEGPGDNEIEDYKCYPFEGIVKKAEKAHNELDPSNAVIFTWEP